MSIHYPGIDDSQFLRGEIPMTKQEVRILALTKAHITPGDTIIDIGAGTGSISIEAALQAPKGIVYAIEREAEGAELINANKAKFGLTNIEVIAAAAPAAMTDLPQADVIFIGGSGGHLNPILVRSDQLLKAGGRLIITAVTVETLNEALSYLQGKESYQYEACCLQVTRVRRAGSKHMFQALNPVYIIASTKGGNYDR